MLQKIKRNNFDSSIKLFSDLYLF